MGGGAVGGGTMRIHPKLKEGSFLGGYFPAEPFSWIHE